MLHGPSTYICNYSFYKHYLLKAKDLFEVSEEPEGWGGRHSSVVSSAPTILRPRVRIPSTPSTLFQFVLKL